MEIALFLFFAALSICVYFIPSYVADKNNHKNMTAIFLLNIFLGWSILGWVIALIWASSKSQPDRIIVHNPTPVPAAPKSDADEIRKLADLKEQGHLTEEEFQAKKSAILGI